MALLDTAVLGDFIIKQRKQTMSNSIELLNTNLKDVKAAKLLASYPGIDAEIRTTLPTAIAAYYLNRKSQTLRSWACFENGPIRPIRINGILAWLVSDIKQLLSGGR